MKMYKCQGQKFPVFKWDGKESTFKKNVPVGDRKCFKFKGNPDHGQLFIHTRPLLTNIIIGHYVAKLGTRWYWAFSSHVLNTLAKPVVKKPKQLTTKDFTIKLQRMGFSLVHYINRLYGFEYAIVKCNSIMGLTKHKVLAFNTDSTRIEILDPKLASEYPKLISLTYKFIKEPAVDRISKKNRKMIDILLHIDHILRKHHFSKSDAEVFISVEINKLKKG